LDSTLHLSVSVSGTGMKTVKTLAWFKHQQNNYVYMWPRTHTIMHCSWNTLSVVYQGQILAISHKVLHNYRLKQIDPSCAYKAASPRNIASCLLSWNGTAAV